MTKDEVFLTKKITNKDIYDKLLSLERKQEEQATAITRRQDLTNGKVKRAYWLASTSLMIIIAIIGSLLFK